MTTMDRPTMVAAAHVAKSVDTIAQLEARAASSISVHQRKIDSLTAVLGRPRTLYVVAAFTSIWVVVNSLATSLGSVPLDPPPFFWLQGVVGMAALLTTITILTTQIRQVREAEQRAYLDLQVSLLAEQKIAKLVALVEELRRDLPTVPNRPDPVAEAMSKAVDPHVVISALAEKLERRVEESMSGASPDFSEDPEIADRPRRL